MMQKKINKILDQQQIDEITEICKDIEDIREKLLEAIRFRNILR